MALNFGNTAATSASTNERPRKKYAGYVNLYLPTTRKDGTAGKYKFGAIGLDLSDPSQAKLLELADKDPEAFAKMIVEKLQVTYNPSTSEGADFAF
jgi:hypothetical protein